MTTDTFIYTRDVALPPRADVAAFDDRRYARDMGCTGRGQDTGHRRIRRARGWR